MTKNLKESDIEKYLVYKVKSIKGIAYKFTSPQRRSVPDRIVLLPQGNIYFIELKAPNKKPTILQTLEHERIKSLGFDVIVIDTKEKVNKFIEKAQA